MFKKLLTALAVAGVSSSALATDSIAQATEQSGYVQLEVHVPEVLVLYHWDKAIIKFTDNLSTSINKGTGYLETEIKTATTPIDVVDTNPPGVALKDTSPLTSGNNLIAVKLENAWAVRSLTVSERVSLGVTVPDGDLVNEQNTNSKIKVKDAKVKSGGNDEKKETINLDSQWAVTKGDIYFNLDLEEVKIAGKHAGNNNTFKLTLNSIPKE